MARWEGVQAGLGLKVYVMSCADAVLDAIVVMLCGVLVGC